MTRLRFAIAHLLALVLVSITVCALALNLAVIARQLHLFA